MKGGPHGQVAPLGVSPHPQPARVALGHLHQVVLGQGLGGDGEGIAHGKALLPPHQGVVGAPEGQVEGAVGQAEGEGGKLGLLVQHPGGTAQAQGLEPGTPGGLAHQGGGVLGHDEPHRVPARPLGQGLHRLGEGDPVPLPGAGEHLLKGEVGAQRQDQIVHRAEGGHPKGEHPPPLEIIQTIPIPHALSLPAVAFVQPHSITQIKLVGKKKVVSRLGFFRRRWNGRGRGPPGWGAIVVFLLRRWNGREPWLAQPGPHFLGRNGGKNPRGRRFLPRDPLLWWGCGGGGCTSVLVPGLRPSQRKARNGPPTGWAGWERG